MSVITYLFGAVLLMVLGALLADVATRQPGSGTPSGGLIKVDGKCPKCNNESLYKRHCKVACEQCGVIRDCADPF